MSILRRLLCGLLAALLIPVANPQSRSPNHAQNAHVEIASVSKILVAEGSPGYLVNYSFDFGGVPMVFVKGLGVVPPRGEYQYISMSPDLEFRDPSTDALIERVPLTETTIIAAKPPLNAVPADDQFPPAYRSYRWDASASLQERANMVLASYFNYLPHQREALTYLATTYTPLPLAKKLAAEGISAQVALLISFPHEAANNVFSIHAQYSVKEGRALSDELRPTSNVEIIRAANDFVDALLERMKADK